MRRAGFDSADVFPAGAGVNRRVASMRGRVLAYSPQARG